MMPFSYKNGRLFVENADISAIAADVKTPFYVYSRADIRDKFIEFQTAAKKYFKDTTVCFAVKSNANLAILKDLAALGAGADIVSGTELALALKAGIPARKMVFSGVGKTPEEIELAVRSGILQINAESEEEIRTLIDISKSIGKKARLGLRINPDIDAKTHAKITTGTKENKFGIDWKRAKILYSDLMNEPAVDMSGIEIHVGSQITDSEPFDKAFARTAEIVRDLKQVGAIVKTIDLGGGLGVSYRDGEKTLSADDYMAIAQKHLAQFDCAMVFEPGRRIVAEAGALVAKVVRVKKSENKTFVVIDAGMNDLMRPALYDAYHEAVAVKQGQPTLFCDIVGPVCESSDVFGKDRTIAPVQSGDLIAFKTAGAYGAAMASTYNMRPLVPEILVDGEKYAQIRRRQTLDDILSLQSAAVF